MLNKKKGRKEGGEVRRERKEGRERREREGGGWEEGKKKEKEGRERKQERVRVLTVLRMKSPVMSAIHLSALITFTLQLCPLLSNYMWEPTTDGK